MQKFKSRSWQGRKPRSQHASNMREERTQGHKVFPRKSLLPPLLLLLGLVTVFVFDDGRGHISRMLDGWDGDQKLVVGRNHLTVAANLSAEHSFLGFYVRTVNADGDLIYKPYNRFPLLGHVLIKLVILPFPGDLSAQVYAAQTLMLAFFIGAAVLAYLALNLMTSCCWVALAATLLAFSSFPVLYYGDMVATEGMMDLFGVMLVFHGMATLGVQSGGPRECLSNTQTWSAIQPEPRDRLAQLLGKTCTALLLGWYVYAVLLPFVALGLYAALRDRTSVLFRRPLTLAVVALLFGLALLALNFAREYFALGGEKELTELPSVRSMLIRTDTSQLFDLPIWSLDRPSWSYLLAQQFSRAGLASLSYILTGPFNILIVDEGIRDLWSLALWASLGVAVTTLTVCLVCLRSTRHRVPLMSLVLSGFCWALCLRSGTYGHEFYGLFHIGIPLVLFALALMRLREAFGGWLVQSVAVTTLPVFALSSFLVAQFNHDSEGAEVEATLSADLRAIRSLTTGKTIYVPAATVDQNRWYDSRRWYLNGRVLVGSENKKVADFVVAPRIEDSPSLTPGNQWLFLYHPATYDAALAAARLPYEQYPQDHDPIIATNYYDVYFAGHELLYVGQKGCEINRKKKFFVHVVPLDAKDLPRPRRRYGYDNLNFFTDASWQKNGKCYQVRGLPKYGIDKISTGQFLQSEMRLASPRIWSGSFSPSSHRPGKDISVTDSLFENVNPAEHGGYQDSDEANDREGGGNVEE